MKLLKVYVDDDFKDLVSDEARKAGMNTSSFSGALIKRGIEGIQSGQPTENEAPHANGPVHVRLGKADSDYVKRRCNELGLTPEQYITRLIRDEGNPSVIFDLFESYKGTYSAVTNDIRQVCHRILKAEGSYVSSDDVKLLAGRLEEVRSIFKTLFRECIKTRQIMMVALRKSMNNLSKGEEK